ncbi:MAG: ribosome maturation factor RimP [Candidatus Eisenbacteria bacterium]|nr:ribosome maturation factor RimP [Candidatus Eisenbacteria bacterium]
MLTRETIADLVRPLAEDRGLELVDIALVRGRRSLVIRIFLDRIGGVTVDDCADLNRQLRDVLDQDPGLTANYRLEVSSAGMRRPIWTGAHFRRFRGEKAVIELREPREGRIRYRGRIAAAAGDRVALELDEGGRIELGLDELVSGHVDLDPWKHPPGSRERNREE